ncbi:hypothetical protein [Hyphomicrobium sp. D-2]|uniref:hypothetical protein n=1 Tax=Hyphomicrobium sp. D-2 TaxID=3041621 RepID=UPI002456A552|nr:hypothetical protein [Hyphomicrobium sp. D-2]MDH4981175.1 hypothetical protein [Hyphomicrobium sp. D-2]
MSAAGAEYVVGTAAAAVRSKSGSWCHQAHNRCECDSTDSGKKMRFDMRHRAENSVHFVHPPNKNPAKTRHAKEMAPEFAQKLNVRFYLAEPNTAALCDIEQTAARYGIYYSATNFY